MFQNMIRVPKSFEQMLLDSVPKPTQKELRDMYYPMHRCCPSCGSDSIETTCVGYAFSDIETAKDCNRASCACGWSGIIHDLLPERNHLP